MKKLIAIIAIVFCMFGFTGCNSCTQQIKNLESDFSELDRDIVVLNSFTGDTVFKYSGPCYIDGNSNAGDITIIYRQNGKKAKKADFIGSHIIFVAVEK